ncbi:SRPBCC domain-containing protein [Arthrobacter pityocampae]|uniref:SRPBCC domain-containing protein n=1 Tax=Arthrobacter pityocampae TaxID=547334 RepID=A0A2S5J1P2_9MICC|nr:SRPBCC domain-containing protein [Arthrobacter pityocampae]PPB50703.1 SRPBCC domain-containing protein [Arthrobacter pityocampae]
MSASVGSTVTRTFAAPPEAVFDAWVTPSSFTTWWGGSGIEVPLESVAMDVRPGGTWRATMILGGDMPDFHWRGEFVDVDRPRRLSMTMTDEPGEARELLSATFTAVDDGTEMVFSQTGGHLSAEQYDATTAGWQLAFDTLDTVLLS